MKIRTALLITTAAGLAVAGATAGSAQTTGTTSSAGAHKPVHHKKPVHRKVAAAPSAQAQLLAQVKALQEEVSSLRSEVDSQKSVQTAVAARVDTTESALQTTQTQVQAVQQQISVAQPLTTAQVDNQIATAIDKEHHNTKLYFKGITITPGGFLELAGIGRQNFEGADIASNFSIPFPNNRPSHVAEGRFSARQSRLSFLAQGNPNKDTTLSMYGEFDFLGGAQTANSNESNSFNPRIRVLYGTIDWNRGSYGLHVLAGQNWSLVTMQSNGISPRSEVTPPQIDAQYIPGFAWARQPGVRVTADFLDHKLWIAASAENPQTTFGGTVPAFVTNNAPAGSGFDSANTLSLNHIPDFIGKVAYEADLAGHHLHLEGFGIARSFDAHFNGGSNTSAQGYGYGGSVNLQVIPGILDAQASGFGGQGIGRYGSAGLPDVTFSADGHIHPIQETMFLTGLTLHATKMLDLYAFAGQEQEDRQVLSNGTFGVGLPTANNAGCFTEGGTCAGNTRRIRQLTGGFWQKIYQGSYGRAQVGVQYSYTQRELFEGVGGMPQVGESMGLVSFRYYPF